MSFSFVSGKTSEALFPADLCASELNGLLDLVALILCIWKLLTSSQACCYPPGCGEYPGFGRLDLP